MRSSHSQRGMCHKPSAGLIFISILILVSLVGSMAGCSNITSTNAAHTPTVQAALPTATPTQVAQIQPPALVETDPLSGAQIALKNPITFYFNQPMHRSSVEAALTGQPSLSGSFSWQDDSTVTFNPDKPLLPGMSQVINIGINAQSAKGMALLRPISLSFSTSPNLTLVQNLPKADSTDVDPTSALVASFSQPVVALGADPSNLPAG